MNKLYTITLVVLLFFWSGCAIDSKTISITKVEPTQKSPSWYLAPPPNDENWTYGVGRGIDAKESYEESVSGLRKRFWEELSSMIPNLVRRKKGIVSHLGSQKVVMSKIKESFQALPTPVVEKLAQTTIRNQWVVTLVRASKNSWVSPLKKEIFKRLVAVEERWWRTKKEPPYIRYKIALSSIKEIEAFLPQYLLVSLVAPFSSNIENRVEQGFHYFMKKSHQLQKRIVLCIEPAPTPALELFGKSLKRLLVRRKIRVVSLSQADSETLCLRISGKLSHACKRGSHIVRGTINMTLRNRFGKIFGQKSYHIEGRAQDSGSIALGRAAERFAQRVDGTFLLSE